MAEKLKILFLCTGNSCRSQMAEGWARQLKSDQVEAYSAGIVKHGLNSLAVKTMFEAGIDISGQASETVDELPIQEFDYVITLCGHANETCPFFPGKVKRLHVGFDDPPALAKDARSEEETMAHFRRVRDEIKNFVAALPENLEKQKRNCAEMSNLKGNSWMWITGLSIAGIIGITLAAGVSGLWVLTAIPVGFLFGFFLEKADLCGSSAFSEIVLLKDWKKIQGIWMIIVVGMVGFSLLSILGLVKLNPKPLIWASYIVGGVIFGVGMVLAGGCVSGSLFKVGQGNINSMAALVGIPIGLMMVEHGPVNKFHTFLKSHVIKNGDGGSVTFPSVLHIPYWVLALLFLLVTIAVAIYLRKKRNAHAAIKKDTEGASLKRIMTRPWRPWQAGVAIGVLACLAYLSSAASGRNYPLGVSHGVMHAELLLTDAPLTYVYAPKVATSTPTKSTTQEQTSVASKKVSVWLILEILALILGSFVSAKLSGRAKLLPKPPGQTITAFFGGIMVGLGAAIAGGCVVGNIMSGIALMSVGNLLFAVVVILTNWIATHFYLMGGSMKDLAWGLNVFRK